MKSQTVKLIALRPFLHGYGVLSVGDPIVTTLGHAKQLLHLGYAREEEVPAPVAEAGVDLLAFKSAASASQATGALELPVLATFAASGANAPTNGDAATASKAGAEGAPSDQSGTVIRSQQMDLAGAAASTSDGDSSAAAASDGQTVGASELPASDGVAASGASTAAGADTAPANKADAESASSGQSVEVTSSQQADLAGGVASAGDEGGAAAAAKPASRGRRQAG